MLETLVSSRIRRTLYEYLLAHPHDRFYLRGLAKELSLSVSPLRRELKQLERSGMLTTAQEANVLFYTVNTTSPTFCQLRQAVAPAPNVAPSGDAEAVAVQQEPEGREQMDPAAPIVQLLAKATDRIVEDLMSDKHVPREAAGILPQTVHEFETACRPQLSAPVQDSVTTVRKPMNQALRTPLHGPLLISAVLLGLVLVLTIVGLQYATMMQRRETRSTAQAARTVVTRHIDVAPAQSPLTSGVMRGGRWQITPGGFGGFSSSASKDSH